MQTPPQRVTRQGRPRNDPARPTTAGWFALIIFFFLAGVGAIAALATISLYTSLASNLTPVEAMQDYELPEELIILDRNGAELARFGEFKREVVEFDEIPPILLDATTAVEDKTFWENAGFDPVAIFSAGLDSLRGRSRGASTITQQLTRMRLLEDDLLEDRGRLAERKLKEIVQSIRLTQHFAGEPGKQDIITAYLNQIYYGNQSYGVKAAARSYFGVNDLSELTPAQAATLAALPKSPSNYDLVRNAVEECLEPGEKEGECAKSQLVVPADTTVVERRNQILTLMAEDGRTPKSDGQYTAAELLAARDEPVVLVPQTTERWQAPQFVWQVRDELATKLCGEDATCPELDHGGLRITTTLDLDVQKTAEKWVKAAAVVPFQDNPKQAAKRLGLKYADWMGNLSDKRLRNGALVAMDYQTGELIAYVGSADYYSTKHSKRFQPKYDVVGNGYRQPGSAFKPFNYAIGIDSGKLTAGTVLMDVGTDFGHNYTPNDADRLERGPVTVRSALQFSLNIPSVKAMEVNDPATVFQRAQEFGLRFRGDSSNTGLSLALGTQETPPVDLVTGYGTIANGGQYIGHTSILTVQDRSGKELVDPYEPPKPTQVISPQAAYITTNILAGNTNRNVNPYWGVFSLKGPGGDRRPATLKTGTNNDAKDLNAYGFIAPPTREQRKDGEYALVVGAWNGNSDNSEVSTPNQQLFSIDVTTYVWQGFLQETTKDWPIRNFRRPEEGLVKVSIDPFTGYLPQRGDKGVDGMVHRGHRAEEPASARGVRPRGPRPPGLRVEVPELAGMGPRLAAARTARAGRGGRSRPHGGHLLLQQPLQPLRPQVGPGHGPGLRRADAAAILRSVAEPGRQRRDPVVRAPGAIRRCAGPRRLPARIGDARAECAAQRGADAATGTHARNDADARAGRPRRRPSRTPPRRRHRTALLRQRPDRGREG